MQGQQDPAAEPGAQRGAHAEGRGRAAAPRFGDGWGGVGGTSVPPKGFKAADGAVVSQLFCVKPPKVALFNGTWQIVTFEGPVIAFQRPAIVGPTLGS